MVKGKSGKTSKGLKILWPSLSLPSEVALSLVEVGIWSILMFNVRRLHMIRYLITTSDNSISKTFFDIFHTTKCRKVIKIRSVTGFSYEALQVLQSATKCYDIMFQVLQSVADYVTKCVKYYKVRQLLEWDVAKLLGKVWYRYIMTSKSNFKVMSCHFQRENIFLLRNKIVVYSKCGNKQYREVTSSNHR